MLERCVTSLLHKAVDARPAETKALCLSFAYLFCLLASFTILRPLRDMAGVAGGVRNLPWLTTATFLAMLAAVPLYGWISSRLSPSRFIPLVSRLFALQALAFAWMFAGHWHEVEVGRVFFVWTSVYNLFVVTIFWSAMVDLWRQEAGVRLFGFIAAGATAGALCGPLVVLALVDLLRPVGLVVVSAVLLEAGVQCARLLYRARDTTLSAPRPAPLGGGVLDGLQAVARSRQLRGISAYVLLMSLGATFMYMVQAQMATVHFADPASRARFFSAVDLAVNVSVLAVQLLGTGRFMRRFGVSSALGALPIATLAAGIGLAAMPTLAVLLVVQTSRRAFEYALSGPAREVLYTVLERDQKYKATSVIETAVRRGGDAGSAWLYALLAGAGVSTADVAVLPLIVMSLLSAGWVGLSIRLARDPASQDHAAGDAVADAAK